MAKNSSIFVCTNCGGEFPKWAGQCATCSEWNTLEESAVAVSEQRASMGAGNAKPAKAKKLSEIDLRKAKRVSSGFLEFDRVLGGTDSKFGFVQGEVVLVSGDPGVGKSTLLLQTLRNLAEDGLKVLYVSAEESENQIALRAKRVFGKVKKDENFEIMSSFDVDSIIASLGKNSPDFVVIDSIQTISSQESRGIAGGIAQVKASAIKLVNYAKSNNVTLLIVGHINKEGNVAGPKTLEHLVDAVFQMEGDERSGFRLIRSLKNRFGTTNEVGILGLDDKGMTDITDAASYFVSKDNTAGVCRSAILEGNRVIVVEIQALTNNTVFSQPKRVAQGISNAKLQVICAILQKHAKVKLYDKDVYINVAGGLRVNDPAVDLAVALAISSSVKSKKIPASTAVLGELSLTGNIGSVTRESSRVKELKRMGYSKVVGASSGYISAVIKGI